MKTKDDAVVAELPLEDERLPEAKKRSRHVQIALNHLGKRREVLLVKAAGLRKEIEEIDTAILALE